jgi:hypothetical protein
MSRYPTRIWEECGHWLNLSGEWVPVDTLPFALSMQTLFRWSHLHDWVKRQTADFQRLPVETVQTPPFSSLHALSQLVEERFNQPPLFPGLDDRRAWLTAFGTQLARIVLPDSSETERVRMIAAAIASTSWITAPKLEVVPYLNGLPAGTARLTDILWLAGKLFVSPLSKAKLAKRVPEEIGKGLSADIRAALAYAFERSPEDIRAYLEENFVLAPEQMAVPPVVDAQPAPVRVDDGADDKRVADAVTKATPVDDSPVAIDLGLSEDDGPAKAQQSQQPQEEPESHLEPEMVTRARAPAKPQRPGVMARFALALGYKADGDDRFFHSDGSWIGRANGARFPWERHSVSGDILRHYYPKEHCLEREPLQIEADVWGLLDQKPDAYSFILINTEGDAVEMTGARLRALRDGGAIAIHPSAYRLVLSGGSK